MAYDPTKDVEILDEDLIKSETIDIEDTDEEDIIKNALHELELLPIVYTTKLDDMGVLKLDPEVIHPAEASARILNESKPVLHTNSGPPRKGRKNTKKFGRVKAILEKIYCSSQKTIKTEQIDEVAIKNEQTDEGAIINEQTDYPDTFGIRLDLNSVKSEVLNKQIEEEKPEDTCKYSELLKLCKPCSVVLKGPVLVGPDGSNQVIHGGQIFKANKVQKPRSIRSSPSRSSEDEAPLITLYPPELLVERKRIAVSKPAPSDLLVERKSIPVTRTPTLKQYRAKKSNPPKIIQVDYVQHKVKKIVSITQIAQRLLRNSLLEIQDSFSNEYYAYYADNESNLLDYFKDTGDKANKYQSTYLHVDCRYRIDNCCWVKKDECIQSLYPKVLVYPNSRFIRRPHPCKPGACTCCCRKKENAKTPDSVFTDKYHLLISKINNQKSIVQSSKTIGKDDVEILDVEDKIGKTIISINKSQSMNEILRNCLIGKALAYKVPMPGKQVNNRRLVTLKRTDSHNTAIVLRNYAEDVIEIYEKDADGDIVSYLKTTCYGNSDQSDVMKLLNKPNSASEAICCWFKREYVITKLQNSITIQPRAAKFIRSNHTCPSKECTCCCKPINEEIPLQKIQLPCRSQNWKSALKAWGLASDAGLQQGRPPQPVLTIVPFEYDFQPSSSSLGKNKDDDCQITSVTTSPTFQPVPQPTVPPSIFVPEAVDGDELSKEVNSLITSILDRFKDVRLTINDDGKVAAALNTPVSTLSTVELKVLANILSYAQSQVDLLGSKVNSGMSLSNIINLKVDDVQSNRAPLDPNSIYKEFGKNVNLNTNVRIQPLNVNNMPMAFSQASAVPQTYTFFTNTTSVKNQHFNDAFSSYINTKVDRNPETITPVIENVYSLKDSEDTEEDSSFTTVWYRKPAQSSASTLSEESVKPNTSKKRSDDSTTEAVPSKKIRVLSPTKLGATTDDKGTVTNRSTAPGKGVMPGIIMLPNNNFNVQSLGQPHTQGMVNVMPPATVSHPILILNPLQDTRGLLSEPIGNNTPNVSEMTHFQSKIPLIINAASTSHLNDTGSNGDTSQTDPTTVPTSMDADITETPDQDSFSDNDPDIDDDPEMDTNSNMESFENDDLEMKYSPENNEEEEDCILGF